VLREKDRTIVRAFDLLADLPDDLELGGREKDPPQKRKGCNGASFCWTRTSVFTFVRRDRMRFCVDPRSSALEKQCFQ
jgi:hypothetical protein